jgi:hypothetical protein
LQISRRSSQHPSTQRDQRGQFRRLRNFHPRPNPSKHHHQIKHKNPFELIPVLSRAARAFDQEHEGTAAVTHANDLCAWLYGVQTGLVQETRYSVNPDDEEIEAFRTKRHNQSITSSQIMTTRTGEAVMLDGATVISQLTNALTIQNKYLGNANR